MKKPKIGIILGAETGNSDQEYVEAIEKAGGEPVVFRPGQPADAASIQGLILSGGGDVDPGFYGEKKEPYCDEPEQARDEFEFLMLKKFLPEQKPVLGICRGVQVLNVALGGTLYQDLSAQHKAQTIQEHQRPAQLSREEKRALRHEVRIQKGTKLHKLFGDTKQTNSRHHQAIKQLAPSLRAVAESPDGLIEAVESTQHPWMIGVQWHPESREVYETFAPLFQDFVRQCAASC